MSCFDADMYYLILQQRMACTRSSIMLSQVKRRQSFHIYKIHIYKFIKALLNVSLSFQNEFLLNFCWTEPSRNHSRNASFVLSVGRLWSIKSLFLLRPSRCFHVSFQDISSISPSMIEQEEKSAKIYNFWDRISHKIIFISRLLWKLRPKILRQEMSAHIPLHKICSVMINTRISRARVETTLHQKWEDKKI